MRQRALIIGNTGETSMTENPIDFDSIHEQGFHHGKSLFDFNISTIEKTIDKDDNLNMFHEKIHLACWEADDGYRQYSPFEFFAKELNECEDPDGAWGTYEEGINEGVESRIEECITEEYFQELYDDKFGDDE